MPAYNFMARFAEAVRSGEKRQTIRRRRKRPTRPGETLRLYTNQRTRDCQLLNEGTCTAVLPVVIRPGTVSVDEEDLAGLELEAFARDDGFKDSTDFFTFWREKNGLGKNGVTSIHMELIQWEPRGIGEVTP